MKFLPQCNNGAHSACKGVLTHSSVSLLFAPTADCLLYNTQARVLHYKMPFGGEKRSQASNQMPFGVESDAARKQKYSSESKKRADYERPSFREHESRLFMCYHMLIKLSLQAFLSKLRCGNRKFFAEILYGISNYATPP